MNRNYPVWILIAAFVIVFGWFGIDKFLNPLFWTGFLPVWMDGLLTMDKNVWIKIVGAAEIGMAVALLIPHRIIRMLAASAIIAHLMMVLVQVGWNDIGVRDLGLLLSAAALLLLLWDKPARVTA